MTDLETVTAAAIFVIVLVVSMKSLGAMLTLGRPGGTILAICVAALSALSLTRLSDDTFETILLPYAALPLAILLLLLLAAIRKCLGPLASFFVHPTDQTRRTSNRRDSPSATPHPRSVVDHATANHSTPRPIATATNPRVGQRRRSRVRQNDSLASHDDRQQR